MYTTFSHVIGSMSNLVNQISCNHKPELLNVMYAYRLEMLLYDMYMVYDAKFRRD